MAQPFTAQLVDHFEQWVPNRFLVSYGDVIQKIFTTRTIKCYFSSSRRVRVFVILALIMTLGYLWQMPSRYSEGIDYLQGGKPAGLKVVVLVFYGRPRAVEILDCYLKVYISCQ